MDKLELFAQVRDATGEPYVMLKAVEEMNELIDELTGAIDMIIKSGNADDIRVESIIDEIADVIITLEQSTGYVDMHNSIGYTIDYKLRRLADTLKCGNLLKGLAHLLKRGENGAK